MCGQYPQSDQQLKAGRPVEQVLNLFARTRTNKEFIEIAKKTRFS